MLATTLAVSALLLTPRAYLDLAGSALFAAGFAANFWFAARTGYFDPATATSPLVHTWSLAVEEQFYLLFPPLLWAAHRCSTCVGIPALIIATFASSLALSAFTSESAPAQSFYLLPARAWELALGALLTFFPSPRLPGSAAAARRAAGVLSWLGLGAILSSLFIVSEEQPYPGLIALLPTCGAARRWCWRLRASRGASCIAC